MKRVFRRGGFGPAVIFGILAASAACADERTNLFVLGNVVTTPPACVARPESGAALRPSGRLDVALSSEYGVSLIVGTQLAPRGDKPNLRTESMITTITGAEVHLTGDNYAVSFTVPANGVIRPEGSDDPGFGIVTTELIPAAEGQKLAMEIAQNDNRGITRIADFTVFGTTLGGREIESAPSTYVIEVCSGCTIEYPPEAIDASGGCTLQLDGADEPPCSRGQDDNIDCRNL
jgi:hypothetical protein